jgi:hypothetical protein
MIPAIISIISGISFMGILVFIACAIYILLLCTYGGDQ